MIVLALILSFVPVAEVVERILSFVERGAHADGWSSEEHSLPRLDRDLAA